MKTARLAFSFLFIAVVLSVTLHAEEPRDLMSDTWVAVDALGRSLPEGGVDCPLPREDRSAVIFYFLWHNPKLPGPFDLSKLVAENPDDPKYGPPQAFHHWGEPELGYYVQPDEFLYRRHIQLLSIAGVDALAFDITNRITYPEHYLSLLETLQKVESEGNRTQKVTFLLNSHHAGAARDVYDTLYKPGRFEPFWFRWQGKPLLMADPAGHDEEVADFFTFRRSWAWTKGQDWFGDGKDRWPWLDHYPQGYGWHDDPATPEQTVVSISQHPISNCGRSFSKGKEPPPEERTVRTIAEGRFFAEQWERALEIDPRVLFITGWNEWIAQRFLVTEGGHDRMMGRRLPVGGSYFVDLYDMEFNRDIEPMQGGTGDAFYYQMVAGIRKYKGARPIPKAGPPKTIAIDGNFDDWADVTPEYRDAAFDTTHRDAPSWGDDPRLVDTSGCNDIVAAKVSRDDENLYFYLETREDIPLDRSSFTLLIDADRNPATGHHGYDYMVAVFPLKAKGDNAVSAVLVAAGNPEKENEIISTESVSLKGNRLELSLPKKRIVITEDIFEFDFHWIADMIDRGDHPPDPKLGKLGEKVDNNGLGHPGFPRHGDSAPDRRFNYRYKF